MSSVVRIFLLVSICLGSVATAAAQSTDQTYPTPITGNELNVLIKARDIGDSRLTTYFYAFDGAQGDIFLNVVVSNFTGDIDVFTVDGLRPLTKIVFYADANATETGRLIYLRKPERLLLRIQGRPPGDDAAHFKIRFGGSFIALAPTKKGDLAPQLPDIAVKKDEAGVIVNSVGTIIGTVPKPKAERDKAETATSTIASKNERSDSGREAVVPKKDAPERVKPEVVVTGTPEVPTIFGSKKTEASAPPATKTTPARTNTAPGRRTASTTANASPPARTTKTTPPPKEKVPDPMANIHLVIEMKTGEVIERPMTEVVRFGVDKGILTVVAKDGKIYHYSILELSKITVQ